MKVQAKADDRMVTIFLYIPDGLVLYEKMSG